VSPALPSPAEDAAVVAVTPTTGPQDGATKDLLDRLRDQVVPEALAGSDVRVVVGGLTAADVDQTDSISERLPVFIAAVILLALLLLVAVFRSVVIAVQAAISNLVSIVAAYGVIAYAAQGGWLGDLVGITTPTPIPAFIPRMMFAILFGLSMDYEVFLVSRIREQYLQSHDTSAAVTEGVTSTGKVILAAALIMAAVFGAFVLDDQIFLKIIGIGMAAAVLVDAIVIRLVLVPSVMHLLGRHNWWIPTWLDRLLPTFDIEGPAPRPAADSSPVLENA
jgi:RND superfamily putative drug exporter